MRKDSLSQHFLRSPRLALMLIGHSNIKKRDLVLDIGAGSGVITSALAKRCREVWAIEPDHATAEKLRQNLSHAGLLIGASPATNRLSGLAATHPPATPTRLAASSARTQLPNVRVFEQDFLSLDLPAGNYKVFANPPFHLSSKIVHKLLKADNPPESFYLILQKQFALKLLNTDRHYTSQLGAQLIQQYQTKIRYPLKPTDFTPPPAVPTVLFEAKRISVTNSPQNLAQKSQKSLA